MADTMITPFQQWGDAAAQRCEDLWNDGKATSSWGQNVVARGWYALDLIASIVVIPFTMIGMLFGALNALATWNWDSEYLHASTDAFIAKVDRFFTSFTGIFSTKLALKFKDDNITAYAMGGLALLTLAIVLVKNPPNKFSVDTDGKWKFGWDNRY